MNCTVVYTEMVKSGTIRLASVVDVCLPVYSTGPGNPDQGGQHEREAHAHRPPHRKEKLYKIAVVSHKLIWR